MSDFRPNPPPCEGIPVSETGIFYKLLMKKQLAGQSLPIIINE